VTAYLILFLSALYFVAILRVIVSSNRKLSLPKVARTPNRQPLTEVFGGRALSLRGVRESSPNR
jgi:hypothetical protein